MVRQRLGYIDGNGRNDVTEDPEELPALELGHTTSRSRVDSNLFFRSNLATNQYYQQLTTRNAEFRKRTSCSPFRPQTTVPFVQQTRPMNPHISLPRQHGGPAQYGASPPTSGGANIRMPRFFKRYVEYQRRWLGRLDIGQTECIGVLRIVVRTSARLWISEWS